MRASWKTLFHPTIQRPCTFTAQEDERVYIAEGNFKFQVGEEIFHTSKGDYVNMHRRLYHNFENIGDTEGVLLVTFSLSGIEDTPDFNPIEHWWSQLKAFLGQFSLTTTKMVDILITTALNLVNPPKKLIPISNATECVS